MMSEQDLIQCQSEADGELSKVFMDLKIKMDKRDYDGAIEISAILIANLGAVIAINTVINPVS